MKEFLVFILSGCHLNCPKTILDLRTKLSSLDSLDGSQKFLGVKIEGNGDRYFLQLFFISFLPFKFQNASIAKLVTVENLYD